MTLELEDTMAAPGSDPPDPGRTMTLAGRAAAPAREAALAAGQQLGHFRIERRLGAGGMGEVYLATDLALDRPVAIKVLPDRLSGDTARRERLVREARAQARISHPNVGHIYFIGEQADRMYFAMEYVAGMTLAERITSGPLALDDALAVIHAAALGLREAQRHGFTHRDVKPSNLMVDAHGIVKVLDFGLAAGAERGDAIGVAAGGAGACVIAAPVAQTSFAGTPLYMAPEQARGEAIDLRADVYALGATLYHLVSGKPPFQADSVDELMSLHASALRPPLPRGGQPRARIGALEGLCARMMAARPDDRFASYDELLRAIELLSVTHTRPAGFLARAIAMTVDFALVGFASGLIGTLFEAIWRDRDLYTMALLLPLLAIYSWWLVGRWGRTLGKSVLELEVIDVTTGARPSHGRAARRALTMLGLPTVLTWIGLVFAEAGHERTQEVLGLVIAAWIFLGIIVLMHASARVSGKRAPWDRTSGTMVRYRTERARTI